MEIKLSISQEDAIVIVKAAITQVLGMPNFRVLECDWNTYRDDVQFTLTDAAQAPAVSE
jgi:hypothetical protein